VAGDKDVAAPCIFCAIIRGDRPAEVVFADELTLAFLDVRPVFPGHVLLVPRLHVETLPELSADLVSRLFRNVQLLTRAVEAGLDAEGVFVAINHKVSQSVPHLHVHLVPRNRGDGLRGFFWPRHGYPNPEAAQAVRERLADAVARLLAEDRS
jgi:histidine triad (HIT) family protein